MAPAGDPAVVAGPEHFRHLPAPEGGGPGVVRILDEAGGERLLLGRGLVPHHAGYEPGDGLDDDKGARLATRQDVVTDGELVVDQVLAHPLVDALVAAAQK